MQETLHINEIFVLFPSEEGVVTLLLWTDENQDCRPLIEQLTSDEENENIYDATEKNDQRFSYEKKEDRTPQDYTVSLKDSLEEYGNLSIGLLPDISVKSKSIDAD